MPLMASAYKNFYCFGCSRNHLISCPIDFKRKNIEKVFRKYNCLFFNSFVFVIWKLQLMESD